MGMKKVIMVIGLAAAPMLGLTGGASAGALGPITGSGLQFSADTITPAGFRYGHHRYGYRRFGGFRRYGHRRHRRHFQHRRHYGTYGGYGYRRHNDPYRHYGNRYRNRRYGYNY